MAPSVRVGLIQMTSGIEPAANVVMASKLVAEAAGQGAELVMTPEMTTLLQRRRSDLMEKVRTEDADESLPVLCALARQHAIHLLIGSMPILTDDGKVANRSYLIDPQGSIKARYDKVHLFDVELPNGESYRESKVYKGGNDPVLASLPFGGLGLTICYDVRFAYLYRALAQAGATLLTVPAAFTRTTGRAHWHVLLRARAIETGCFVLAPAQTGEHADGRQTFGHSLVVDPWGEVLLDAGEDVGASVIDLDLSAIDRARTAVPSLTHDRVLSAVKA